MGELSAGESSEEEEAVGAVSTAVTMVGSTWLDMLAISMSSWVLMICREKYEWKEWINSV